MLQVLHDVIQAAMVWFDYHLWEFTIGERRCDLPMDENRAGAPGRRMPAVMYLARCTAHSSFCSSRFAPTSRVIASSLGKMPTTTVTRPYRKSVMTTQPLARYGAP